MTTVLVEPSEGPAAAPSARPSDHYFNAGHGLASWLLRGTNVMSSAGATLLGIGDLIPILYFCDLRNGNLSAARTRGDASGLECIRCLAAAERQLYDRSPSGLLSGSRTRHGEPARVRTREVSGADDLTATHQSS